MCFDRDLIVLISAVAFVLALAACQPISPETVAVEVEPPVPGEHMGTADSLQDHDTSHTKLDQLKPIIQRWEESVQLDPNFHRLIALAPDHANAYFGRGAAYAALGDFDKAIPDFDTAIQLDPDHALAYFNCGVAYAALGNTDQAVENLEASLVTDPKASYVPQVRAMLAKLRTQRE